MRRGKDLRVVVIGAGCSGIILALEFKKQLGLDVQIYERYEKPGGTWMANVYPGCACDIPSHWYSLSSEIKKDWKCAYSGQPEIQAYLEGVFRKHNLERQTHFGQTFVGAKWDDSRKLYIIDFHETHDKSKTCRVEAEILVSAIGGFSTPAEKPLGLEGVEHYQGTCFHSARWDYGVDLKNKRVAVIGNGPSAVQFIPEIAKEPTTHVLNFSRTPSWCLPRFNSPFGATHQWILGNVPGVARAYRNGLAFLLDSRWYAWVITNEGIRKMFEDASIKHIEETAPREYLDFLRPKYPLGCKRVVADPGYLACLHQPNVDLITEGIATVTEKGIRGINGTEYEFDVLILATGFDLSGVGSLGLNIIGTNGKTLTQQWIAQKGPQAYLGTTVANFPNFFMSVGPNVITGHSSTIASIECQVNYICKIVKTMRDNDVTAIELKEEAETDFNAWLQKELKKLVFMHCTSYYRLNNGKIIVTWPGTMRKFWWMTLTPNYARYHQTGGNINLATRQRTLKALRTLAFALLFGASLYLGVLQVIGMPVLRSLGLVR